MNGYRSEYAHIVTAVWKTVPHRAKHLCQSDKSAFEKKLSGETNTDYKDITDFLTEEPVKVNGHAPEKSADLIVFIHFYVLLGDERTSKRGYFSHLAADCNHGILNGYAPEYVGV